MNEERIEEFILNGFVMRERLHSVTRRSINRQMLGWTIEEVDNNTEEQRVQHLSTLELRTILKGIIDPFKPMHRIKKHLL